MARRIFMPNLACELCLGEPSVPSLVEIVCFPSQGPSANEWAALPHCPEAASLRLGPVYRRRGRVNHRIQMPTASADSEPSPTDDQSKRFKFGALLALDEAVAVISPHVPQQAI